MPKRVLIVDDDASDRRFLEDAVTALGYPVTALGAADALAVLRGGEAGDVALVLLDLTARGADNEAVLAAVCSLPRRKPVIVQMASGGAAAAQAMRAGAFDFVVKPVASERLEVSLRNALRLEALEGELLRMRPNNSGGVDLETPPAASEAMNRTIELAKRAARSSTPLLIEGEAGTGKGVLAKRIHAGSARAPNPFIALNCSALRTGELENILFGTTPHGRQVRTTAGKLDEATGGTLFLDEITELSLSAQARLLSAIEQGAVYPPGLKHSPGPGVRLIAATERNLLHLVAEGRFREDLYYRLTVCSIRVPPLRERLEDLPELAKGFAAGFAAEVGKRVDGLAPEALALLLRYDWPGNIRQLENAVFRAVVLAESPVLSASEFPQIAAQVAGCRVIIPAAPASGNDVPPFEGPAMLGAKSIVPNTIRVPGGAGRDAVGIPALGEEGEIRPLEAVEADLIRLAFGRYRGRMTEIAKRLGIGRSTLYRKLREIGLEARAN
jgi:DNA-binding NtrC family response regulator